LNAPAGQRDPEAGRRFDRGPARAIPIDPDADELTDGVALCLSGGGYRAMLFHAGALLRMNELGLLPRLARVSSVSGGSICAGRLAVAWPALEFGADGVAGAFESQVVEPLRALAGRTLDARAVALGLATPFTINRWLARLLRPTIGRATLETLTERPEFIFNATSMQTGGLWLFSSAYMGDYSVGRVDHPKLTIARIVAASAAFPPFLSPATLRLAPGDYAEQGPLARAPFTTRPMLTDGGVYDNLGLEAVFKRYRTLLVSDAGGHIQDKPKVARAWAFAAPRVTAIIDNQVRELRKQKLIDCFNAGSRDGAFWGIRSNLQNFPAAGLLPAPVESTEKIAGIRTRLKKLPAHDQERLINWGYAAADAALRSHYVRDAQAPRDFPYAATAVG
jgi:NTE family protein